jgi:hypothetical protein
MSNLLPLPTSRSVRPFPVGVGASATLAFLRPTVLETRRQLNYFSIPVSECKDVGLLLHELVARLLRSDLSQFFVTF